MKLLLICPWFIPQENGMAVMLAAHAAGFIGHGHDVTVATTHDETRSPGYLDRWKIKQFKFRGRGHRFSPYVGETDAYRGFLLREKFDVFVFHGWQAWTLDLALPVLDQLPGRKILVSHGFKAHRLPHGWGSPLAVVEWLAQQPYVRRVGSMLRRFDHVVFLSRHIVPECSYDYRRAVCLGLSNTSIIPNGSDPAAFLHPSTDIRSQLGVRTSLMLLQVARFEPLKNQDFAIRAFLKSGVQDATLVLIGNEMNDYSRALMRRYQLSNNPVESRILFLPRQTPETIRSAYAAADLYVCSSETEVQSLSVLDAMAAGKPFVSRPVGCHQELPGGSIARTVSEMAEAIRHLATDPLDRVALGEKGRKAVQERFNWGAIVASYEKLLTERGP